MNGAVVIVRAGDSVREFIQIRFAEEDDAGAGKFPRDGRIFRGHEIAQDFRARGRADSPRPNVVFQRNRYSEEGGILAPIAASAEQLLFRPARSRQLSARVTSAYRLGTTK